MTTALTIREFETHRVREGTFEGRRFWVARDVGTAIGYSDDGKGLVDLLAREWADELMRGTDFDVFDGADVFGQGVENTPRTITVLYESGMHLVCIKTNKPAGKRLRRQFADEWAPQLARDGRYLPEREVTAAGEMVERGEWDEQVTQVGGGERAQEREARLAELRITQEPDRLRAEAERLVAAAQVEREKTRALEISVADAESRRASQRAAQSEIRRQARLALASGDHVTAARLDALASGLSTDLAAAVGAAVAKAEPFALKEIERIIGQRRPPRRGRGIAALLGDQAAPRRTAPVAFTPTVDGALGIASPGADRNVKPANLALALVDAAIGWADESGGGTPQGEPSPAEAERVMRARSASPGKASPHPGRAVLRETLPAGWHWMSDIAKELGLNRGNLGKAAAPLNLKAGSHSRRAWVLNRDGLKVEVWVYDDFAADCIREAARKWKAERAARAKAKRAVKASKKKAKTAAARASVHNGPTWRPGVVARELKVFPQLVGQLMAQMDLHLDDKATVPRPGTGGKRRDLTAYGRDLIVEAVKDWKRRANGHARAPETELPA